MAKIRDLLEADANCPVGREYGNHPFGVTAYHGRADMNCTCKLAAEIMKMTTPTGTDAKVWADDFVATLNGVIFRDGISSMNELLDKLGDGWAATWFAAAIEAGRDAERPKPEPEPPPDVFRPGDRVACRALPEGEPTFGPYTVVGLHADRTDVYDLRDDYETTESSGTAPGRLLVRLTPENDTMWRVRDAELRVKIAIELGHPWPIPRARKGGTP